MTEIDGYTLASAISASNNSGKREHKGDGGGGGGDGAGSGGCSSSSLSSDSGGARGDIVRMAKQLIVGPRGKRVQIRGLRQHLLGLREAFEASILRV